MAFNTLALFFALLAYSSDALPSYRLRLPNGDRVPCPDGLAGCAERVEEYQPPLYCPGVGHATCAGGSLPTNPFGEALKAAGYQWTVELCMADSDGDGATNGEELGDPCCTWSETQSDNPAIVALLHSVDVSHPGVSTSVPDTYVKHTECAPDQKGTMDDTKVESFFIPGEDMRFAEFFVDNYEVPSAITTYEYFSWNWDECAEMDCYMTGMEAIVDNAAMAHHYIIEACETPSEGPDGGVLPTGFMSRGGGCERIGGWAPGRTVMFRAPPAASQPIGRWRSLTLQFHYDNKKRVEGARDSSGFRIYYTTQPRNHTLGSLFPINLSMDPGMRLPPGEKRFYIAGECTLEGLEAPARLFQYGWHGHEVASEMYDTISLGGETRDPKSRMVFQEPRWVFDDQGLIERGPETYLNNGDHIHMTCVFDTSSRRKSTMIGPETSDEMCWHQFAYYPESPKARCTVSTLWTGALEERESALEIPIAHPLALAPATSVRPYVQPGAQGRGNIPFQRTSICYADELNDEFSTADDLAARVDMQAIMEIMTGGANALTTIAPMLGLLMTVMGCACPSDIGFDELRPDLQQYILSSKNNPLLQRFGGIDECPSGTENEDDPSSGEEKSVPPAAPTESPGSSQDTMDHSGVVYTPSAIASPTLSDVPESSAPARHLLSAGLLAPFGIFFAYLLLVEYLTTY